MSAADYDVLVIGGGGAGMAAAITADDAGASVIIAEAASGLGGSTRLSGGVLYAAGTSTQRAAGIDDSAEAMYDYYVTLNQWKVEPALARRLSEGAAPALEWLAGLGVAFPPDLLYRSGVERTPRGHAPAGRGAAITDALEREVRRRPIDVALGTRVEHLLVEEGRVVGARAGADPVRTRTVVVATGGFGHNGPLLERFYPDAAAAGDWTWSISAPECRGDAIALADEAGAAMTGYNRGLLLATPGFSRQLEVDPPGWLVWVNREGRRFVAETAPYAVMSGVMKEQGGSVFAVFDEAARVASEPDPAHADAFAAGAVALNFVAEVVEEQAAKGRVLQATTLDDLARAAGLPPEALAVTVERYNAHCARGADPDFFKHLGGGRRPSTGEVLRPVATPPFYAVELRPAIVCLTAFGPRIDADARILDRSGRAIPGLYGAGECTGGVMGERYVGGGNSIANAIVFGRIAGAGAAREAAPT